jgi:F-type H+-transporting ATPase subunit a
MLFGLDFPPVSHLVEWPGIGGSPINKVIFLMFLSALLVFLFFFLAGRKQAMVPKGVQNAGEAVIDFVEDGIVLQTMGPDGLKWVPFMTTLFSFIFVTNIWGIIPAAQMPVNARVALPAFLAILIFVLYNVVGIKAQGLGGYLKSSLFPPGVPKALYVLVTPIEFITVFLVRPFSLAVRLFANLLAGHLLLVTFALLTAALFTAEAFYIFAALPFAALVALTGFELLVAVLQAFVFTILAAVYIGGSMHPDH